MHLKPSPRSVRLKADEQIFGDTGHLSKEPKLVSCYTSSPFPFGTLGLEIEAIG